MLFNSYVFWLFFLAVFLLYKLLRHRWQNRMLLAASYLFYGWWDWRFLSLLLISTVTDYWVGRAIGAARTARAKKAFLIVSLATNLGLLGFFKYCNFFIEQFAAVAGALGLHVSMPVLNVVLPVGISFYTFQELSYTIDVYRGKAAVCRRLEDFALFVAFFPQLVAGPIERYTHLIGQIQTPRIVRHGDFASGLYCVLLGLFKKVIIADNMAAIATAVFQADPATLSGGEVLMGVYAFAFQIYGDFSGYSLIAQGVARWLGFDLMDNFRMPYFARDPSEFWSRWHISLSSWLRDYLYIPLGGNRGGRGATYRNLALTMLLGGLWHGAAWTFVLWGAFHGAILIVYRRIREWRGEGPAADAGRRFGPAGVAQMLLMFHLVCVGWVFFRAESAGRAWAMLARVFADPRMTAVAAYAGAMILFFCLPLVLYELWVEKRKDLEAALTLPPAWRVAAYSYLALMLWFFGPEVNHAFIYFQF